MGYGSGDTASTEKSRFQTPPNPKGRAGKASGKSKPPKSPKKSPGKPKGK